MSQRAFTLIEILVVFAIVVVLGAVVVPRYRAGEKNFALERSAYKLAQDIRRSQEMAMSARELSSGSVPQGGYGVYFEDIVTDYTVYLYADITSPWERYNNGGGGDEIIDTISLEKEVKVKDVKLKKPGNEISPSKVSINFEPPDPSVSLKSGVGEPFDEVEITISLKADENKIKIIKVNSVGLIYVDQ